MRNPKWHRDETILALDLYFNQNRGSIDKSNPNIIHLSQILNSLPVVDLVIWFDTREKAGYTQQEETDNKAWHWSVENWSFSKANHRL